MGNTSILINTCYDIIFSFGINTIEKISKKENRTTLIDKTLQLYSKNMKKFAAVLLIFGLVLVLHWALTSKFFTIYLSIENNITSNLRKRRNKVLSTVDHLYS